MDIFQACQKEDELGIALIAFPDQGVLALLIVDLCVHSGNALVESLGFN